MLTHSEISRVRVAHTEYIKVKSHPSVKVDTTMSFAIRFGMIGLVAGVAKAANKRPDAIRFSNTSRFLIFILIIRYGSKMLIVRLHGLQVLGHHSSLCDVVCHCDLQLLICLRSRS